jgi:hypothetical protein
MRMNMVVHMRMSVVVLVGVILLLPRRPLAAAPPLP